MITRSPSLMQAAPATRGPFACGPVLARSLGHDVEEAVAARDAEDRHAFYEFRACRGGDAVVFLERVPVLTQHAFTRPFAAGTPAFSVSVFTSSISRRAAAFSDSFRTSVSIVRLLFNP